MGMFAIIEGNASVAHKLLNLEEIEIDSVDVDGKTCLMCACANGLEQIVKRLSTKLSITDINKKDSSETTALMYAIQSKNESVADQLLNLEGIEVDSTNRYVFGMYTCLMVASEKGLDTTVKKLLPKLSITDINKQDIWGTSALMYAIKNKNESVVDQLLNVEG